MTGLNNTVDYDWNIVLIGNLVNCWSKKLSKKSITYFISIAPLIITPYNDEDMSVGWAKTSKSPSASLRHKRQYTYFCFYPANCAIFIEPLTWHQSKLLCFPAIQVFCVVMMLIARLLWKCSIKRIFEGFTCNWYHFFLNYHYTGMMFFFVRLYLFFILNNLSGKMFYF